MSEEDFLFAKEDTDINTGAWKVLVVDDEKDVHDLTSLVLSDFKYLGKSLRFLNALSGEEGRKIIEENSDIAMILLDVVMETDDAGLKLVDFIRKEKGLHAVRIILRTGQPGSAPERSVIDNYDIDGYKAKTELTSQKLYTTVRSALKNFNDIRIAEESQRNLKIAEETSELRESLTSMIIHDLKNPLSTIRSVLELWKSNSLFSIDPDLFFQLKLISQASETISEMVLEQLSLSQLEAGRYEPKNELVDLNQLARFIYLSNSQDFDDSLKFEFYASPTVFPQLYQDKELIRRTVTNLFSNAIRHTPKGFVKISFEYDEGTETLTISVSDSGIGIKEEDIPHLFDKFYQAVSHHKKSSNFGIGLSFCDFAVKAMGGTISVKSVIGQGTDFIISIPAKKGEKTCEPYELPSLEPVKKEALQQEPQDRKGPGQEESGSPEDLGIKVLLVDDSSTIRKIMTAFLKKFGIFQVDEARDGKLGVDKISENPYDLVFFDISMPIMGGLEAAKIVKSKFPDLRIVMLTAEFQKREEAKIIGVTSFLTKPFTFDSIQECLKNLGII